MNNHAQTTLMVTNAQRYVTVSTRTPVTRSLDAVYVLDLPGKDVLHRVQPIVMVQSARKAVLAKGMGPDVILQTEAVSAVQGSKVESLTNFED